MKIAWVNVRQIFSQDLSQVLAVHVNNQKLEEGHTIASFRQFRLVKLNDFFYLLEEPDSPDGIWHGFSIETKWAVALRKEFEQAHPDKGRGPVLNRVNQTAYNKY